MRIIHLSDLHFPTKLGITTLRGKSLLGYGNYFLRRKVKYPENLWTGLVTYLSQMSYDALLITGDLTNVSHPIEFERAYQNLAPLLDNKAFLIPGNHDRYKKEALAPEPLFEKFFGEWMGEVVGLRAFVRKKVIKDYVMLGWDSNKPMPPLVASGYVEPEVFSISKPILQKEKVILLCHHPLWNPGKKIESRSHRLKNRQEVAKFLSENPPLVYLHGHTHTNWFKEPGPILPFPVVNSASSSRLTDNAHHSGFHLIQISAKGIQVERHVFVEGTWQETALQRFQESEGVV